MSRQDLQHGRARKAVIRGFSAVSGEGAIAAARADAANSFAQLRASWVERCAPARLPDGALGWEADLAVTFSLA